MKSYKIPVLVKVRASDRQEAEAKVNRFMGAACIALHASDPRIHASVDYWNLAELKIKVKEKK